MNIRIVLSNSLFPFLNDLVQIENSLRRLCSLHQTILDRLYEIPNMLLESQYKPMKKIIYTN